MRCLVGTNKAVPLFPLYKILHFTPPSVNLIFKSLGRLLSCPSGNGSVLLSPETNSSHSHTSDHKDIYREFP